MPIPIETFHAAQTQAETPRPVSTDLLDDAIMHVASLPRDRFADAWIGAREALGYTDDQMLMIVNTPEPPLTVEQVETLRRARSDAAVRMPEMRAMLANMAPLGAATDAPAETLGVPAGDAREPGNPTHDLADMYGAAVYRDILEHGDFADTSRDRQAATPIPMGDYAEIHGFAWGTGGSVNSANVTITAVTGSTGVGGNGGAVFITSGTTVNACGNGAFTINPPTPEELAAAAERMAEHRKIAQEADKRRLEAKERARALLLRRLSTVQRAEFENDSTFRVMSQKGRVYRIRLGWSRNVDLLDADGKPEAHFCLHPETDVPEEDNVLAQKLLLECCEDDFLKVANKSLPAANVNYVASGVRIVALPSIGPVACRADGLPLCG